MTASRIRKVFLRRHARRSCLVVACSFAVAVQASHSVLRLWPPSSTLSAPARARKDALCCHMSRMVPLTVWCCASRSIDLLVAVGGGTSCCESLHPCRSTWSSSSSGSVTARAGCTRAGNVYVRFGSWSSCCTCRGLGPAGGRCVCFGNLGRGTEAARGRCLHPLVGSRGPE